MGSVGLIYLEYTCRWFLDGLEKGESKLEKCRQDWPNDISDVLQFMELILSVRSIYQLEAFWIVDNNGDLAI